jgi:hypothetical protein
MQTILLRFGFLFLSFFPFLNGMAQSMITKGEFYNKSLMGLEKTKDYKSGDSTFLLELTLYRPDTFHVVTVAWYMDNYGEGNPPRLLDSSKFGIREIEDKFTVSLTRSAYAWPVGFYVAKVYLDGVFQETYSFKVLSEEVVSAQYFSTAGKELQPVEVWNDQEKEVFLRVYLDRYIVDDGSELEAVWFFELPAEAPLFLDASSYVLESGYNYVDFKLKSPSAWPGGFIVTEIWLNKQFKKFYRIEVFTAKKP